MTPELIQLGFYAGFAVLGWAMRHWATPTNPANPVGPVPLPTPVLPPVTPGTPASGFLAELEQFLSVLAKLQSVQPMISPPPVVLTSPAKVAA